MFAPLLFGKKKKKNLSAETACKLIFCWGLGGKKWMLEA